MKTAAIIVAAGRGARAGGGLPKQWRSLSGRAVAAWTLDVFLGDDAVDQIVLVLHPDDMGLAPGYSGHAKVDVVAGGASRRDSVCAGLEALSASGVEYVLIHDVARPLVTRDVIGRVRQALTHAEGAAPGVPVVDALWLDADGIVSETIPRKGLVRAQTPQGFHFQSILNAHRDYTGDAADDVEVARAAGMDVAIVLGDENNIKITTAEDFERAEKLMRKAMDIRIGNGFDVHKFCDGTELTLCGVTIAHDAGLLGHSDADVAMHAATDAIYGALADGDIGQHFPPSDPQWKGAASHLFLEHAVQRATARGYGISNLDITIICEKPKIGPHSGEMRRVMAEIIGISIDQVSVKATTSETLGFTGRGEGIASSATVCLVNS